MVKVIKYAVVNILQDSVENNKFTYFDHFHDFHYGRCKRWDKEEEAIKIAEKMYNKEPHVKGQYYNWAVLEQIYRPMKRVPDKLLRQKIVFCANPNFIFT